MNGGKKCKQNVNNFFEKFHCKEGERARAKAREGYETEGRHPFFLYGRYMNRKSKQKIHRLKYTWKFRILKGGISNS